MEWEHAKIAVIQEACKKGYNVNYVVVETDISKIDFPEGSVVESHDAGMYKNEDAYCMISKKMQKGAYEEFTQSIALAEAFVSWAGQEEAKQAKKEANKKKRHGKKIAAKAANKIDAGIC